ncbi:citrate/2-methylcitrate synthase [Vibrio splendidus]
MGAKSQELAEFVASELGILVEDVKPTLSYQSIPQWDSIKHVTLMLALEQQYSINIDEERTMDLTEYRNIERFIVGTQPDESTVEPKKQSELDETAIHRGLREVYADTTTISHIDGSEGSLLYRGYPLDEVVSALNFEQTAFLLIEGRLATDTEQQAFNRDLVGARALPDSIVKLVQSLKDAKPIDVLRTAVSALGAVTTACHTTEDNEGLLRHSGLALISQLPLVLGYHQAALRGEEFVQPPSHLTHAQFVLACLNVPYDDPELIKHFDNDLIVHAEHGSNASAFTARIATGAESDIHAIITAAISTFQGALHGGAAEEVLHVVEEARQIENITSYVQGKVNAGQSIMGFGHRVYRTEDPRVKHLYRAASFVTEKSVLQSHCDDLAVISTIRSAMSPYRRHGIDANVDLYAGVFYKLLGLDRSLSVPLFAISRVVGWLAQVLEQKANNILIRPRLRYVGEHKSLQEDVQ